ncbi:trace amine-associated receptor 13c-like [Betta splendens]|uniref:Trace amine-associated receptor 13c-like n=1 Tax=Betta splendens TaxID=158456 RepID=A0A9W2XGP9_BETSP|nr:trace amine-associated receptor 13c-like [Betta splendens]
MNKGPVVEKLHHFMFDQRTFPVVMEEGELCFPQLLNASCRRPNHRRFEVVFVNILLTFISVLTTGLNLLVIITISYYRKLHSSTNLLLLSLAVSDFMIGLLQIPVEILIFNGCWFLGDIVCALNSFLGFVTSSVSVGNMLLISVDRYLAICEPMYYPTKVTVAAVRLCVCLCWILSVIYSSWIVRDLFTKPDRYLTCFGECVVAISYIEGTVDFLLTFVGPITVIIVLYMRVFVVAVSQARAMRSHVVAFKPQSSATANKSELKAARNLGVVVVVFLLCFSPYYICSVTGANSLDSLFQIWLLYFNSCLNPVIYALFYPWFRKAIKHIITLQILQPGSCEANIL